MALLALGRIVTKYCADSLQKLIPLLCRNSFRCFRSQGMLTQ